MSKRLSERIAERLKAKKLEGRHKTRAGLLALKKELEECLQDGWSFQLIWEQLTEEKKLDVGYSSFCTHMNKMFPDRKIATNKKIVKEDAITRPKMSGFSFNPNANSEDLV